MFSFFSSVASQVAPTAVSSFLQSYQNPTPTDLPEQDKVELLEGVTSFLRIAMYRFTPIGTKLNVENYAINFQFPTIIIMGLDANSITRTARRLGKQELVVIKRVVRIMLDLFPPIPTTKKYTDRSYEGVPPITKLYFEFINGLMDIRENYFKVSKDLPKRSLKPLIFDYNPSKDVKTDEKALKAIEKSIHLIQHCCSTKVEGLGLKEDELETVHIYVKNGYKIRNFETFVNLFEDLKEKQKEVQRDQTIVDEETKRKEIWNKNFYTFKALDELIKGKIAEFKVFSRIGGTLIHRKAQLLKSKEKPASGAAQPSVNSKDKTTDQSEYHDPADV